QRLAVGAVGIVRTCRGRDVTREAESVGLGCPSPEPAGERECLSRVARGLIDPPGRKIDHPRAQRDEPRVVVHRATAELLDGARDQREGLVHPPGEGVCGAERRDDRCYRDDELPRSREVVTPLEDPGRTREIPATKADAAEPEQSKE